MEGYDARTSLTCPALPAAALQDRGAGSLAEMVRRFARDVQAEWG